MDAENYQSYLGGDEYNYQYGGFWEMSPVELVLPYDNVWYLVIDSYLGRIKYWLAGPY